jgi:hypothetical protein
MRTGNHSAGGFAVAAGDAAERALGAVAAMEDFAGLAEAVLGVPPGSAGARDESRVAAQP